MGELDKAIKALAQAKAVVIERHAAVAQASEKLSATPEWKAHAVAKDNLGWAQSAVTDCRAVVEGHVLNRYRLTGEKGAARKDAAWVTAPLKVVVLDEAGALDWCATEAKTAISLSLNRKIFDGLVKGGVVPSELAKAEENPSVSVASDLSKWLEE